MMNDDWINKLRESLADYQEPVEADLWGGIEQSLVQQHILDRPKLVGEAKKYKFVKWAVAAAVALMVVGSSYVYLRDDRPHVVKGKHSMLIAKNRLSRTNGSKVRPATVDGILGDTAPVILAITIINDVEKNCASATSATSVHSLISEDFLPLKEVENPEKSTDRLASPKSYVPDVYDGQPVFTEVDGNMSKPRTRMALNIKLYAENGFVGNLSLGGNGDSDVQFSSSDYTAGGMFSSFNSVFTYADMLKTESIVEETHHRPVSVGMQVGLDITPRLSITTGIVYTKAESDFVMQGRLGRKNRSQVLHYVGVPLGVNYRLWGMENLRTYVNIGGECDFNVKNKTMEENAPVDMQRDASQWSIQTSLGVQYDVVPQIGIYVEPGAKYYFDNGSDIRTTFKDKKLNFNFQFGLRVNIGK